MAYAPCGSQHKDAVQITLEQIDLIKRLIEQVRQPDIRPVQASGLLRLGWKKTLLLTDY